MIDSEQIKNKQKLIETIINTSRIVDKYGSILLDDRFSRLIELFAIEKDICMNSGLYFTYNSLGYNGLISYLYGITITDHEGGFLIQPKLNLGFIRYLNLVRQFLDEVISHFTRFTDKHYVFTIDKNFNTKHSIVSIDGNSLMAHLATLLYATYFNTKGGISLMVYCGSEGSKIKDSSILELINQLMCIFSSNYMCGFVYSGLQITNPNHHILFNDQSPSICLYDDIAPVLNDIYNKDIVCQKLDEYERSRGMINIIRCNSNSRADTIEQMPDKAMISCLRNGRINGDIRLNEDGWIYDEYLENKTFTMQNIKN